MISRPPTLWTPQAGRQADAYHCLADELFYGGAAGGGKTDLLLGVAGTQQWRSIIFRRIFPSTRGIIERSREVFNPSNSGHERDSYNESLHIWRLTSGRQIEFGSMQYEKDKENYRGRPHDGKLWDEITEFTESQFRFVNTWNRSTKPGQRCRVIATGNPPTSAEGEWVILYWGPWLNDQYPHPAKPGELRYFVRLDDRDVEVESAAPITHKGETLLPRSRTFIPARLSDNPILAATGYGGVLQSLPEPLRSQLLYGDFKIKVRDDPYQVIPLTWIQAAVERWRKTPQPAVALSALGCDIARGGDDKTVIAPRYEQWFAPLQKHAGSATPTGRHVAQLILGEMKQHVMVNLDVIGIGSSAFDQLSHLPSVFGINFGEGTSARDKSGRLTFANVRAAAYWFLREALSPDSGFDVCLPDDRELIADLAAPHWFLRNGRISVESKEDIKKRLGRSTDCGDAVVLAWYYGGDVESTVYDDDLRVEIGY